MLSRLSKFLKSIKYSNSSLLGVDFSAKETRVLQLTKAPGRYVIKNCLIIPITLPVDNWQSSVTAFKDKPQMTTAVPFAAIMSREVSLSYNLNIAKLEEFLQINIQKHTGINIGRLNFDYQILQRAKNFMRVLWVAAKRELIEQKIITLKAAGLYPQIIDVDVYALARAIIFIDKNRQQNIGVVNIDNELLTFCFMQQAVVVYGCHCAIAPQQMDCESVAAKIIANLQKSVEVCKQHPEIVYLCGEYADFRRLQEILLCRIKGSVCVVDLFKHFKDKESCRALQVAQVNHASSAPVTASLLLSLGLALHGEDLGC